MPSSPREDNRVPSLVAKSDADNTPVTVEADPVTKRLKVNATITGGSTGGTEYIDQGAVVPLPTGTSLIYFDGTNTPNAVKTTQPLPISVGDNASGNIAAVTSSPNALVTAGGIRQLAALSAGSLNADLVPSTDVSNFAEISVHVTTSAFVGTLQAQGSNDNTNWLSVRGRDVVAGTNSTQITVINTMLKFTRQFRYFRMRMTAYTSGTATGVAELFTVPAAPGSIDAQQVGTNTVVQSTAASLKATVLNQDGSGNNLTSTAGSLNVVQQASTATLTNVASSATNVTLLASNAARKGGSIYNDSTQVLYVKYGTTASATSFVVPLAAATYFEINAGYTGNIDGIWASANGNARVTEIT